MNDKQFITFFLGVMGVLIIIFFAIFIIAQVVTPDISKKDTFTTNSVVSRIEPVGKLNYSNSNEKLQESIKEAGLNEVKLKIDMDKDVVKKIIKLSSFLASGSGARGTPSIFVNEEFVGGYLSPDRIKKLLK